MNKKKKQNGFTIVELVIVIAVIGILAAVLIPTFSNLIQKAKHSADRQLVYYINEAVIANEVENGKEATMYDTLQVLEKEYGFTIEKMTPRSDSDIVWDSVTNRFALVKDGTTIEYTDANKPSEMANKAKMWRITTPTDSLEDGYSHYLTADWTGTVEVTTGVDVGENDDITSVNYARTGDAQTADIRTNGGTLTVNALADTVNHYGDATVLNIEAVDTENCYREFGTVANAQIKKGKIVIESEEAKVENLLLIAKADKSAFEKIVVETKTGAELPTFDRTDVVIAEKGTLVLNVVTPTTDEYIYLTKAGVIEQIVVTNEVKDDVSSETANVASKSATTQTVAEQVANVGTKNEDGNYVDSNGNEIALEDLTSENVVIAEAKADETAVQTGLTKFSGGAGTEKSPFLIASEKDWETLALGSKKVDSPFGVKGYSYKVVNDLDMSYIKLKGDRFKFKLEYFHGTIDFDNHQMTWMTPYDTAAYCLITNSYNGCTIKNANFNLSDRGVIINNSSNEQHILIDQNIVLQNINIYGNILADNSNNYAPFYSYWMSAGSKLTMINCNNYCNITSSADNTGIFVGRTYGMLGQDNFWYYDIELINCNNYGTLININGNAGMLFSNAGTNFDASRVTVENCVNYGTLMGSKNANLICGNLDEKYYVTTNANYDLSNNVEGLDVSNKQDGVCGKTNSYTLNFDENGNFVLPQIDSAEYYLLSFVTTYYYGGGATTSIVYRFNEEQRAALDFKAYEFSVGAGSNKTTGATATTIVDSTLDGKLYVKDGKYIFINSITKSLYITRQPTVSFMAFDENGNLLAGYNYTYSN